MEHSPRLVAGSATTATLASQESGLGPFTAQSRTRNNPSPGDGNRPEELEKTEKQGYLAPPLLHTPRPVSSALEASPEMARRTDPRLDVEFC